MNVIEIHHVKFSNNRKRKRRVNCWSILVSREWGREREGDTYQRPLASTHACVDRNTHIPTHARTLKSWLKRRHGQRDFKTSRYEEIKFGEACLKAAGLQAYGNYMTEDEGFTFSCPRELTSPPWSKECTDWRIRSPYTHPSWSQSRTLPALLGPCHLEGTKEQQEGQAGSSGYSACLAWPATPKKKKTNKKMPC